MNHKNGRIFRLVIVLALCLSLVFTCYGCSKAPSDGEASSTVTGDVSEGASSATSDASGEDASAGSSSVAGEEAGSGNSVAAPEASSGETAPEAPVAQEFSTYDYTQKMEINVDLDALSALDNESLNFGMSNKNRDEQNRPTGLDYYDVRYQQYNGITHFDTDEKTIYLTMDEGYENGCTPTILDTLKEKGVKAVFFVTKQFVDEHPELVQRMIDEGHIVGNHTCSHPAAGMPSLGLAAEYEDIKTLNDMVYDQFGYQMRLFRFPGGIASPQSVALLDAMGYQSVFWSFAYLDYDINNQMDPDTALQSCLDYLHPGAIYLLHAVSTTNTKILGDFIDGARAQGFEFGVFPVEVE